MASVKHDLPAAEQHVAMLLGKLMVRTRWKPEEGLRMSHLRVLSGVPPTGTTITDLAERVGMTKQGAGQFVTQLVDLGHLRMDVDPSDARARLVQRTGTGDELIAETVRRHAEMERTWAEEVGAERYAAFRSVLEELALADD
jgi:DNA-binding MarR family transcriptional regulator